MGSFVITLREGFEAALVVCLILAYLAKTGHLREHVRAVWAGVAFVGVAREGVETSLFLFASTKDSGTGVTVIAASLGLVAAIALGVLFYRGAVRLDLARFFTVTSFLVIGFAAYLIYGGVHELAELAGSGALQVLAAVAAAAYGGGFAVLYLRDARRSAPRPSRAAADQTA